MGINLVNSRRTIEFNRAIEYYLILKKKILYIVVLYSYQQFFSTKSKEHPYSVLNKYKNKFAN